MAGGMGSVATGERSASPVSYQHILTGCYWLVGQLFLREGTEPQVSLRFVWFFLHL